MLSLPASIHPWLFGSAGLSFALYGATSFGYAIVYQLVNQLLSLFGLATGEVSDAVQELYVCSLPVVILQTFLFRRHLDVKFAMACTLIPLVTQPLGLLVLFFMEGAAAIMLKRALGGVFLAVAIMQCRLEMKPKEKMEPKLFRDLPRQQMQYLLGALVVEGFFAGLFGTGGPPLMIYLFYQPMELRQWRANQAAGIIFMNLQGLLFCSLQGQSIAMNFDKRTSLALGALIGLAAGNTLARHLSLKQFQQALLWMIFMGAFTLLASGYPEMELAVAIFGAASAILVPAGMMAFAYALKCCSCAPSSTRSHKVIPTEDLKEALLPDSDREDAATESTRCPCSPQSSMGATSSG